jgi:hypothetical protein
MPPVAKDPNQVTVKLNWVDVMFKIMSALVVPLVLWGVKLETSQATQDLKIVQLEESLKSVKEDAKAAQDQKIALAVLTEQMKVANKALEDIKAALNAKWPPR